MPSDGSFLVEDFLGAITSQLDRTQDALAAKAVNRPLTYAIKDFSLDLKVFVDVDSGGRVRFRSPGPGEQGASVVTIAFTTITRPMIQENTVSMAAASGPTLARAGLSAEEQTRLERMGVRTTADLQRLKQSAGTDGVARLSDIPVDRLRRALAAGRPQVNDIRPVPATPTTPKPSTPTPTPGQSQPPRPLPPRPVPPRPAPQPQSPRPIFIPAGARRLELVGRNLAATAQGAPTVRLDGMPLAVEDAGDGRLLVDLPHDALVTAGTLEVDHGDGEAPQEYALHADPSVADHASYDAPSHAPHDPWAVV